MMGLQGKRILFLSVSFFNYEKAISKRLTEMGAKVDFYDERPSNSNLSKGIIRFNRKFYHLKINRYYNRILAEIQNRKYDYFFLIKGEATPTFFLEKIKENHPGIQMIYYTFDSLSEYPSLINHLKFFDKKFTFEYNDALQFNLNFRPLFYIEEYKNLGSQPSDYDLVFIGSAHTDRYLVGEKIRTAADKHHIRSYFYYYGMGEIAFRLKKMIDRNLKQFDIKKVSFKKLNHFQIIEFYRRTKAVLDINKPFQHGLTIRTFEVLASGRKLITTNADIKYYPFYCANNILIIDRENVQLDPGFFTTAFKEIPTDTLHEMSLDSFIACLFIQNQDHYWNSFRNK